MSKTNSTVKIKNRKVILSDEISKIIESWRREENCEWVDKYMNVLFDNSNNNSKFEIHHIIPAFLFKDENNKSRKEWLIFANEIKNNKIKLSITNHIMAHYYLWKIFQTDISRRPIYLLLGKIKLENFTEDEIKEFAKIQEDCSKENRTKEDIKEYNKNYNNSHKKEISKNKKQYYLENKDSILELRHTIYIEDRDKKKEYNKKYYKENKNEISEQHKDYRKRTIDRAKQRDKLRYENNKEKILEQNREHRKIPCFDPIRQDNCTYSALYQRKRKNVELYKDVNLLDCIIKEESVE